MFEREAATLEETRLSDVSRSDVPIAAVLANSVVANACQFSSLESLLDSTTFLAITPNASFPSLHQRLDAATTIEVSSRAKLSQLDLVYFLDRAYTYRHGLSACRNSRASVRSKNQARLMKPALYGQEWHLILHRVLECYNVS